MAPYTWSVSTGLPPGLGLSLSGTTTTLVGTPTTPGTYAFILNVFDSQQNTASIQLSISINSSSGGAAINTTSLPNGSVNVPYTGQLICTNCFNYTWSVSSGNLPTGLQLNATSGAITGTPALIRSLQFSNCPLRRRSTVGTVPVTQIFSITINAGGLSITTTSLPVASQNTPYSATVTGTGGTPPYTWSFSSTANDGLTIGASTGIISGSPTATGQFTLSVLLTDSQGLTATKAFSITVSNALSIVTTTLPAGTINVVYPTRRFPPAEASLLIVGWWSRQVQATCLRA